MGKNKFLKRTQQAKNKSRFVVTEAEDYNKLPPIFSLERVQSGKFCFSKLNSSDKAAFADAIFKRRSLTWNELQQTDRHKLGCEKIAISSIKAPIPRFITEDNHNLIAFRYKGKKAMISYRIKNIFYVLWFDHSFELYDH